MLVIGLVWECWFWPRCLVMRICSDTFFWRLASGSSFLCLWVAFLFSSSLLLELLDELRLPEDEQLLLLLLLLLSSLELGCDLFFKLIFYFLDEIVDTLELVDICVVVYSSSDFLLAAPSGSKYCGWLNNKLLLRVKRLFFSYSPAELSFLELICLKLSIASCYLIIIIFWDDFH